MWCIIYKCNVLFTIKYSYISLNSIINNIIEKFNSVVTNLLITPPLTGGIASEKERSRRCAARRKKMKKKFTDLYLRFCDAWKCTKSQIPLANLIFFFFEKKVKKSLPSSSCDFTQLEMH